MGKEPQVTYCRQDTAQLYTCALELFVLPPSQMRNGCWNLGNFPPQFCPGSKIKPVWGFVFDTETSQLNYSSPCTSLHLTGGGTFWWDIVCLRAGCRRKPWSTPFLSAFQKRPLASTLSFSLTEAFANQRCYFLAPRLPDTSSCCSALLDC